MALTPRSARLRVAVALLVLASLAAACGGDDKKSPPTTVKRTTTTLPPAAPLTGLPQTDEGKLSRPALMVKVDNTPSGVAVQEGLDKADVVFVEMVEGGQTRIAAVYQSQDATVGPVRSARTSDVEIAGALNKPLLAYSGANGGVLRQVRSGPLVDAGIDQGAVTPIYQRNQRGRSVYRFFLPTGDIYEARGSEGSTPIPLFQYLAKKEKAQGEDVKSASVRYGATTAAYDWNAKTKKWDRIQNGAAHVMPGKDDSRVRVAPANVVILMTPYRDSGFRDVTGAASPMAVLQGTGEAWFLVGGKLLKGSWSRPGPVGPFTFTAAFGIPVKLTPGQTFIELAPGGASAGYEAAPPTTTTTTAKKTTSTTEKK
jgi:hypothetical protein